MSDRRRDLRAYVRAEDDPMSGTTSRGAARGLLVGRRDDYAGHWYLYGPYLPLVCFNPHPARRPSATFHRAHYSTGGPVCGWAPVPAATAPREEVGEPLADAEKRGT